MIFELYNHLDRDADGNFVPHEWVEIEPSTSICEEETIPQLSYNDAVKEGDLSLEDANEMLVQLQGMLADLDKRSARVEEEARGEKTKTGELQEATNCMVCFNALRKTQLLECGHSACYACLRLWWTRHLGPFGDPILSTDEEDSEDDDIPTTIPFSTRPRYFWYSAVDRKKKCPECKKDVTHRPTPSGQVNSSYQATKDAPRRDIWRGIFHPEDEKVEHSTSVPISAKNLR